MYTIQLDVMDDSSCGVAQDYITITVNNVMDISISEEFLECNIIYDVLIYIMSVCTRYVRHTLFILYREIYNERE